MRTEQGLLIGLSGEAYSQSVHRDLNCTDCHNQSANWEDLPHFSAYRAVECSQCHEPAVFSYKGSFHGAAWKTGSPAPRCIDCHSENTDPHRIQALSLRSSEDACRRCHTPETKAYDAGVHTEAAQGGKNSPGCVSCHKTHSLALPPSAGAVNKLCETCHPGAMNQVRQGEHREAELKLGGPMSCASCHDVHATHRPHLDAGVIKACQTCHPGYQQQFAGSAHEELLVTGKINCISCHRTHQVTDAPAAEQFGCGACHTEIEAAYRSSAHRLARLHGDLSAAGCADCHEGHQTLPSSNPQSKVNIGNIPKLCGSCHGDSAVITSNFVRLPISLPSYTTSVHGRSSENSREAAVCTDCHGSHNLQSASQPNSLINKQNLASTCGRCHQRVSREYASSIHGRAVALGIWDSPSCTDCHDEHLILNVNDPNSAVNPQNQAHTTCGRCHENREMAARYGLPQEVVESYTDSYHGWAIKRGGKAVAVCMDCHNAHEIRAAADPSSSIHKNNVVATCGRCHSNSNAQFAASYTHILARGRLMVHDWVRIVYIWLIALVLGGMLAHNLIIFARELLIHHRRHLGEPAVRRMTRSEIYQHLALAFSFFGLAVTGFALRFPEAWWAELLARIGLTEENRRIFHRILAVGLVAGSVYHIFYLGLTQRGWVLIKALRPNFRDLKDMLTNISHHINPARPKARFGMFDYAQKAEYWALVWGTAIMGITGFVLWFPTIATSWLPAWTVRVCEVIHFYEAILAVSAIFIWHFFSEIFLPREYPLSLTWLTGRLSYKEWKEKHSRETTETGEEPELLKPVRNNEHN